jgi:hypothetical protein
VDVEPPIFLMRGLDFIVGIHPGHMNYRSIAKDTLRALFGFQISKAGAMRAEFSRSDCGGGGD